MQSIAEYTELNYFKRAIRDLVDFTDGRLFLMCVIRDLACFTDRNPTY